LEALGLNLGYLLVQVFNFAILFVVLRVWVYKPILGLLEKRRITIAQGLEDARIAAEARQNAEQEAQKILADAQAKANQTVREASERAEVQGREVLAAAEAEAAKKREEALAEVERYREDVLSQLAGRSGRSRWLRHERSALPWTSNASALIDEVLLGRRVRQGGRAGRSGMRRGSGSDQRAAPVSREKEAVRRTCCPRSARKRPSPSGRSSILGGLVVRGDKVLDGSVSGQLETMRQSLY
jgi:F-type H+-transporting ATPase subunit b